MGDGLKRAFAAAAAGGMTEARHRVLTMIAASKHPIRPSGADLTITYWLAHRGYVECRFPRGKVQTHYAATDLGRAALAAPATNRGETR